MIYDNGTPSNTTVSDTVALLDRHPPKLYQSLAISRAERERLLKAKVIISIAPPMNDGDALSAKYASQRANHTELSAQPGVQATVNEVLAIAATRKLLHGETRDIAKRNGANVRSVYMLLWLTRRGKAAKAKATEATA